MKELLKMIDDAKIVALDMDGTLTAYQEKGKLNCEVNPQMFLNAYPLVSVINFINKLNKPIHIYSYAPNNDEVSIEAKKKWLQLNGVNYVESHFPNWGERNKPETIKSNIDVATTLLIDDDIADLKKWESMGGMSMHTSSLYALIERNK